MTFSTDAFFTVTLGELIPGVKRNFPLYVYLPKNRHLLLRHHADLDEILMTNAQWDLHNQQGLHQFWVPNEYRAEFEAYLKSNQPKTPKKVEAQDVEEAKRKVAGLGEQEESSRVGAEATAEGLTTKVKGKSAVDRFKKNIPGQFDTRMDLLRVNAEETDEQTKKDLEVLSEWLEAADGGHAANTAHFAVLFGLSLGHVNARSIADLVMGAKVHDLGFLGLNSPTQQTPDSQLSLEQHTLQLDTTCELLGEIGFEMPIRVEHVVLERRARWDGKGFPQTQPQMVHEFAQIVAFASAYENLLSGRETGTTLSPEAAAKFLLENKNDGRFNPAWVERFCHVIEHPEELEEVRGHVQRAA